MIWFYSFSFLFFLSVRSQTFSCLQINLFNFNLWTFFPPTKLFSPRRFSLVRKKSWKVWAEKSLCPPDFPSDFKLPTNVNFFGVAKKSSTTSPDLFASDSVKFLILSITNSVSLKSFSTLQSFSRRRVLISSTTKVKNYSRRPQISLQTRQNLVNFQTFQTQTFLSHKLSNVSRFLQNCFSNSTKLKTFLRTKFDKLENFRCEHFRRRPQISSRTFTRELSKSLDVDWRFLPKLSKSFWSWREKLCEVEYNFYFETRQTANIFSAAKLSFARIFLDVDRRFSRKVIWKLYETVNFLREPKNSNSTFVNFFSA